MRMLLSSGHSCFLHYTEKECHMHTLAIFVGSLRKDSINKKLARALADIGKDIFAATVVDLDAVPMYNQDTENNPAAAVAKMKEIIAASDAVLFVTPEYNRSIPAVLKNALDWGSRPPGHNSWAGKPAAVAGITPSAAGTAVVQSHLRSILTVLGMRLVSQPEVYLTDKGDFFDAAGAVSHADSREFLLSFLTRFGKWVERQKKYENAA